MTVFSIMRKRSLMMKAVQMAVLMAFTVWGSNAFAAANFPTQSVQRVYFNSADQIIGESLRYCSADTQHWGQALESSGNWVEVLYSCDGVGASVVYASVSPNIRATFCTTYVDVCLGDQPNPQYQYVVGPITQGFYSN
jgi:type IV secretory pathway TraG/TraD family ATPase VirD4